MLWSLNNISKPRAIHITIGLTDKDTFSIEKFNRRLKSKFKDEGLVHLYSFELSENDNHHLHCMFIYNAEINRSYYTVYKTIRECAMLDGVRKQILDRGNYRYHLDNCLSRRKEFSRTLP